MQGPKDENQLRMAVTFRVGIEAYLIHEQGETASTIMKQPNIRCSNATVGTGNIPSTDIKVKM